MKLRNIVLWLFWALVRCDVKNFLALLPVKPLVPREARIIAGVKPCLYTTRNGLAPAQIRVRELVHELRLADKNAEKILVWEKLKKHGLHVSISTVGGVISRLLHRCAIAPITSVPKAV